VLAALYQELGRVLSPQPFVSATIGLGAFIRCGDAPSDLVDAAVSGESIIVLASGQGTVGASVAGSKIILSGTVRTVLDAGVATHLLVPIDCGEAALALIGLPHPGMSIVHRPTWDQTRQVFDIEFKGAKIDSAAIVVRGDAAASVLDHAAAQLDLALACDAIGGSDAIFTETLDYMGIRQQFGRSIASFQALKHRCADLKMGMEASRSLTDAACRAFSDDRGDWLASAACSRIYTGSVYRTVTEEAVQFHGGIGFTWEHDCHLFLKRARFNDVIAGSPEQRKDKVAPALFRAAYA
jgi:alkylation response protein AidB-like acyl-CoA dehydrogenase